MSSPSSPRLIPKLAVACALLAAATANADDSVDYLRDIKPIFARKCVACHGAIKHESALRLDTVASMKRGGDSGPVLVPAARDESLLWQRVSAHDKFERMPPEAEPLTKDQLQLLGRWIDAGAPAPDNEEPQTTPREHWSFQPLRIADVPVGASPIDHFVDARLAAAGLSRSEPADPVALVRRMFFDLHGLPPAPSEIEHWTREIERDPPAGIRKLSDDLLASPRYGERIAQFWLDIVRYADTHGYEVNTPRENAWPYRDYVIRAFNDDVPYDRFIREQLAGDQLKADPATGFLVASAVLLPGQIGKDDASIRLARQDALDEIIIGTSTTFLGLTMGCARCHDHKFDPITQDDYYSLQAYFAGVEYGDRPVRNADLEANLAEANRLEPVIADLEQKLTALQPLAFAGRTLIIDDEDLDRVTSLRTKNGHGTNPDGKQQGDRDDVGDVGRLPNLSRSRYTWWDNTPGEDLFTWNPGVDGQFHLWISWGVHGSGVHTRDARYVLDQDGDLATKSDQREIARADQYYFSGQTSGVSEQKPLWSGLADAGVHQLSENSRLILRGGETGTGITADVIVLQETSDSSNAETGLPQLRAPVSPALNIERFAPVPAKFVRFSTFATNENNRYEPCIDELEVFSIGENPTNIALAERGTIPSASGNFSNTGKHQLKHINDGRYGNSRSWISNEKGAGWVQLEFPEVATIERIVWARDREGKFRDRLPIEYRIDASTDGESWSRIAGSDDRLPNGTPFDESTLIVRNVSADQKSSAAELTASLAKLRKRKTELETPDLVYAGLFRQPDQTFLLNRGDPEQPREQTHPHVPAILGEVSLPIESNDIDRRRQLADWIASPANPLTARVMVNRLWQMHFGVGLVETPSDFGMNGAKPSHPELLDWLAHQFVTHGWSVKHIHRLILASQTYQQSSQINPDALAVDADCRLLWRFPSRRLEGEAIRDAMLAVSGELNLKMGGPGFDFFQTRGGLSGFPPVETFGPDELRRMIYAHKIRMEQVPVFGAFDCPDAGQPTPKRTQSTTAIQALNLFNSTFVNDRAAALAKRVREQAGEDINRQIDLTFQLALGREPSETERTASRKALEQSDLTTLGRVLFNSNEFLFVP